MTDTEIRIECTDRYPLRGTCYRAAGPARGAVVIASALGVPRRFYAPFARSLAAAGWDAVCFDYRGIGDSADGPVRGRDMRMQDWGALDLNATLGWALWELRPAHLVVVGHSAGGQLAGLAAHSAKLSALITVAATAPHPELYPGASRWWLRLLWSGLVPLLARGDSFPARRIGMGSEDIPAGVARQWAAWASKPGYMFNLEHGVDTTRYARLRMPLLGYAFDDDVYASFEAVDALLARYSAAPVERRRVRAGETGGKLGHFGFFRERHRDTLWRETLEWIEAQVAAAPAELKRA